MAHCVNNRNGKLVASTYRGLQSSPILVRTVSAQISHDHMATAFHFLISNLGGAPADFAAGFAYTLVSRTVL